MSNNKLRYFVRKNFGFFRDIYKNETEMCQYYEKFHDTTDKSEIALFEFLGLHEFYRAMKSAKNATVKLIMIISLVEKLSSKGEYVDFAEWLRERGRTTQNEHCKSMQKYCMKMWGEYNKEYGCSGKFRRFFTSSEYIPKEEQINLLQSVEIFVKENPSSPIHPFCHDEKCPQKTMEYNSPSSFIVYPNPMTDCRKCPLFEDDKKLRRGMGEYAQFLYDIRNRFVHNAFLATFPSGKRSIFSSEENIVSMTRYRLPMTKKRAKIFRVFFSSGADQLETVLNRNFKKLLESYIENNIVSKKT